MKTNPLKTLSLSLLTFALSASYVTAETNGDFLINHEFTSSAEFNSSEDSISIYNTGMNLNIDNGHGFSADFRGSVDDKIDEIDSRDFELGTFVKELNVNYQINTEDAVLLLSVGKMPAGVKVDPDDPREVGGVMGVRLSIQPEKVPLIQSWLTKNKFKINRIDIVRYKSGTENTMDFREISNANMTSYALFLSKGHNLQTFFIYKTPDSDNVYGVTSKSVGAVYMLGGKLQPQFFVLKHKSKSQHMELDLMVLSTSIAIAPEVRGTFSYSNAYESVSDIKKEGYDFSLSKTLKKNKDLTINGTVGVKYERGTEGDNRSFYVGIEAKF